MAKVNPFLELYLTEGIAAEQFAQLFSPVLARESETHTLFQPGNIVLVGLQAQENSPTQSNAPRSHDYLSQTC